jgi:hypothetical protein
MSQEFLIIGRNNHLSEAALCMMMAQLLNLRWVGDLHDWNIDPKIRRLYFSQLEDWEGKRTEPKLTAHSADLQLSQHGIRNGIIQVREYHTWI